MFTENLVLTTIQQNYFSNANFLAKEIKKILQLLSKRELSLQSNINEIKHSRLLFLIETVFHKDVLIEEITINHINDLKIKLTDYLKQFITDMYLIEELFKTLYMKSFCEDVINTKNKYLNRIKTCIKQINTVLKENKIEDDFTEYLSYSLNNLQTYLSIIRKQYSYIWYPKFFQENYFTLKPTESFYKLKLNVLYDKLFLLLEDLVISYNLIRLYYEDGKDTYFVQKNNNTKYAEAYYMQSEISKYFHCGLDVSGGISSFNFMMKEHMFSKFGNCINKIFWEGKDYLFIHIEYKDNLYAMNIDFSDLSFAMVEDKLKFIYIDYENNYTSVTCNYRLRGKTGQLRELKNFFIYGQDSDYIEYEFKNNEQSLSIKFKINELVFENNHKKLKFSYEHFFNLLPEIYNL